MPGVDIDVKFDIGQVKRVRRMLRAIPGGLQIAISRAINKTLVSMRSRIAKGISAKVALKQRDIRAGMHLRKASRSRLRAFVRVTGRRFALIYFGARQTKRGLTYRIDRRGGRKTVPRGFAIDRFGGHAFKRMGAARLPIVKLKGLSVPGALQRIPGLITRVEGESGKILERFLDQQVKVLLEKN